MSINLCSPNVTGLKRELKVVSAGNLGAMIFFQLVSLQYECGNIILTSNKS